MAALGEAIERRMNGKGWNQGQLKTYSELSKGTVSLLLRGKTENPTIKTLAAIAKALGASVDEILTEAGLLPPAENPGRLSLQERQLIQAIRSIPTQNIRWTTLELVIGFATVARDADAARQEEQKQ